MTKSAKIAVYSVIAIVLFTTLFYFYNAEIFEATIVEHGSTYDLDISLRAYLDHAYLPEVVSINSLISVAPSLKGWFLLIICLVGIPIMIGYRVATNNAKPESANQAKVENKELKK